MIHEIVTYKHYNSIVFDDAKRGLKAEALVGGVPQILAHIAGIKSKHFKYKIRFSELPFSESLTVVKSILQPKVGTLYNFESEGETLVGWLCPALGKYFKSPPETLFFSVEAL
jgi:hypothetical protein